MKSRARRAAGRAIFVTGVLIVPSQALAQDSSLLAAPLAPPQHGQLMLDNSSFIYRKLPPESEHRELQLYDIIEVVVDYRATMLSEGDASNKRTTSLNAVLADWLKFNGKDLIPSPQSHGDQKISGSLQSQFKTEADLSLKDALTFKIAAYVVDIMPNGNLVIEARREIVNNDVKWQQSLTGVVRRQSIGPDRTVRSDEVAELRIDKREVGFIRDGINRGWFTRWYDKWKPF